MYKLRSPSTEKGYTKIKGRGTSSWNYKPKKPYKLNLYYPRPLFGFTPYKKWILLAEYLDGSMLCNSVPFEMAKMLGMPYTNTIIPAQLTLNGNYQGFYAFTEHKEVGKERIDIGEDGVLLELDVYMDEDWQFKSDKYKLPVIVKYPKEKDGRMNQAVFDEIKDDFNQFEALVYDNSFPNNDYLEYFDKQAFANYMVVFLFTLNREITHPKSVYIHKKAGGKYEMSIVWDFDQGYGFGVNETHYDLSTANAPLFLTGNYRTGNRFFKRLMTDPELQDMVRERWTWFRNYKYAELRQHVEQYAKLVEEAFYEDHKIWGDRGSSNDLNEDLYRVLDWLDARALYLDNYVISFTE